MIFNSAIWSMENVTPRTGGMQAGMPRQVIKITHLDSGLTETCSSERSQHMNRMRAAMLIVDQLIAMDYDPPKLIETLRSLLDSY